METITLTELFKYGGLVGVLAVGLIVLWKRYDAYTARTQSELIALRNEVRKYMEDDRKHLEAVIEANTRAFEKMMNVAMKSNEVMTCVIREIQEVKKSKFYSELEHHKTHHK